MMNWAQECNFDVLGFAVFALLAALPLALALSWATLKLYRRAVNKAMGRSVGEAISVPAHDGATGNPSTAPLKLKFLEGEWNGERNAGCSLRQRSISAQHWLSATYALAGATHAAVVTALMFFFDQIDFLPLRFSATWFVYAWPVIPVLALTAAGPRKTKAWVLGIYFIGLLLLDIAIHAAGRFEGAHGQMLQLWAILMGPPTLLLWALGNRALRCVGLIGLLVAMVLTLAWFGSFQALGCLVLSTRSLTLLAWMTPLRVLIVFAFGTAIWLGLRYLAWRFRRAQTSDLMLTVDSWWLLITIVEMLFLASTFKAAAPTVLLAFAAYKLVVAVGLRWSRKRVADVRTPNLLILRVFGYGRRTERLLDEVGLLWRYIGPINLIASADIAASFLEPDELVQFLSGRLSDAYVADTASLTTKLQRLADRSADGRYALNEFFCRDNAWRACVYALAARSDAVFMDLRSFGPANRGCEFELGLLLEHVMLEKIIFLVDDSTDVPHLVRTLSTLKQQLGARGVNATATQPVVQVLRGEQHGAALVGALLDYLFKIARNGSKFASNAT